MSRLSTLYIDKESHNFSSAHYTIFSATERERLHGHNYSVAVRIVAPVGSNGLSADYNLYKNRIADLCEQYDEYLLLAENSPYQRVEREGENYLVHYADDVMRFLCSDTLLLPLRNITVEELSGLLLEQLVAACKAEDIVEIELSVSSGQGQRASSVWQSG